MGGKEDVIIVWKPIDVEREANCKSSWISGYLSYEEGSYGEAGLVVRLNMSGGWWKWMLRANKYCGGCDNNFRS